MKLGKDLRFPKVADHLQSPTGAVARLQVAPADAQFLDQSLPRLPGNDDTYRAVSLDMNGQIAIRARGEDHRSGKRTGSVRGFNVGRHGRRWRRR